MAEGKKSFLLYVDLIYTVKKLSNEQAGELFKHILEYVNDNNPVTDNLLLELVFEPIKQGLKRDLKKYEETLEKRKKAGQASADKRQQTQHNPTHVDTCQQEPTLSTDSDTDIDTVSDIDSDKELSKDNNKDIPVFNFKKSLIALGVSENVACDWLKVRKTKKASNTETAFESIKRELLKSPLPPDESIRTAVENSWQGFKSEWVNNLLKQNGQTFNNPKGSQSNIANLKERAAARAGIFPV